MSYNPKIHNRQSIRLKGYDYSKPGRYFITICIQNRKHLLGKIIDSQMILNDAGKMIEKWYYEMENKYPNIKCDEYIVMPNHFHCIIEILYPDTQDTNNVGGAVVDAHVETSLRGRPDADNPPGNTTFGFNNRKYNASLFDMMDWFKTMTTNEYIRGVKNKNWPRFEKRLWQKRYWDHILRNEDDYIRISNYIKNNPENWNNDDFNT